MTPRPSPAPLAAAAAAALLLSACGVEVDVQSPPQSVNIPVTSFGQPIYAEVAVDVPEEAQSAADLVTVNAVQIAGAIRNPGARSRLNLSLRLAFTGTATPDAPVVYTNLAGAAPANWQTAEVLVEPTDYLANTTTPFTVTSAQRPRLAEVLQHERIYFIVSNTLASTGLPPDPLPLQLQLQNVVFSAQVEKRFEGITGAQGIFGL